MLGERHDGVPLPLSRVEARSIVFDRNGRAYLAAEPARQGYGGRYVTFDLATGALAHPVEPVSVYRSWRIVRRDREAGETLVLLERRPSPS